MATTPLPPTSPGEILVHGTWAVSIPTALLLAQYFGTTPEFWENLQLHDDLVRERENLGLVANSIESQRTRTSPEIPAATTDMT